LVHSDDPKFFASKTLQAVDTFHEIGLVAIREDFNLPRMFWAQLPGNFKCLSRLSYLPTSRLGLFTNIHSKTAGSYRGTKWGIPVSLLRKYDGSPYYFNFHNKYGNGNTIIVGPARAGKTTFMRFFLTQATRLVPRIIYIDVEGKSDKYIEAIGGKYIAISADQEAPYKINPFNMDNFGNNEEYFKDWLVRAIYPTGEDSAQVQDLFRAIAKKLIADPTENKLELLKQIIADSKDSNLIESFNKFVGSPIFSNLYTASNDELKFFDSENIIGLNISALESDMQIFDSYLGILLHKISKCLDGKPTIIAMNKAFLIYDIHSYSHLFGIWLENVNKQNAMALLSTEKLSEKSDFQDFYSHMKNYGLQIYLSDKFADKYFKKSFGLTDDELNKIKSYSNDRRMMLIKQDETSLLLSLPLKELQDELSILVS
jgi:type IV secretion system protein VirB4